MVIDMLEIGRKTRKRARVFTGGTLAIGMKVCGLMMSEKATVSTLGRMVISTRGTGPII